MFALLADFNFLFDLLFEFFTLIFLNGTLNDDIPQLVFSLTFLLD